MIMLCVLYSHVATVHSFALHAPRCGGGRARARANVAARAPPQDAAEWRLLRDTRKAIFDYELIAPGDRVAVAVSGGKDSSTLAYSS
jgi:hypothetical protein